MRVLRFLGGGKPVFYRFSSFVHQFAYREFAIKSKCQPEMISSLSISGPNFQSNYLFIIYLGAEILLPSSKICRNIDFAKLLNDKGRSRAPIQNICNVATQKVLLFQTLCGVIFAKSVSKQSFLFFNNRTRDIVVECCPYCLNFLTSSRKIESKKGLSYLYVVF